MEGSAEANAGDTKPAAKETASTNQQNSSSTANDKGGGQHVADFESPTPSSIGETIDDIVNELRSSGVQLSLDDSLKRVVKEDEGQPDVEENDRSCESPHGEASVATTVSLHSPVSSEDGEISRKEVSDEIEEILPAESDDAPLEEEKHSHSESARMEDGNDTLRNETSEERAAVQPQKVNGEVDGCVGIDSKDAEADKGNDVQQTEVNDDTLKAKTSKTEAALADASKGSDDDLDEPLLSLKRKDSKARKHAKQGKARRHALLKVSMTGMLHKKMTEDVSMSPGNKKRSETKSKRPLEPPGENDNEGGKEEPQIQVAKRSRRETLDPASRSPDKAVGKPEQQESEKEEPKHKTVPKKSVKREVEDAGSTSVRSDESETSEACPWSLEEFVASDRYLKDVIGRSLGSTTGRFLTIELPEVDTVKRRRTWRAPSTRRSRPIVYGGCDPAKVYVTVMGVKVPISCWSQIDAITPNVLVTDIFEDVVRWQLDAAK